MGLQSVHFKCGGSTTHLVVKRARLPSALVRIRSASAIPWAWTGSGLRRRSTIALIALSASMTAARWMRTIRERVIGGLCASEIVRRRLRAMVRRLRSPVSCAARSASSGRVLGFMPSASARVSSARRRAVRSRSRDEWEPSGLSSRDVLKDV